MTNPKKWIFLFLFPSLALFAAIFAYPIGMIFGSSFFNWRGMSSTISFVGLQNFIKLFSTDATFHKAMLNTVVWVALQSTVHVALGALLALILVKKPFGWKAVRTAYMFPNIISLAVLGIVYLNLFNPQHGIVNVIVRALGFEDFNHNWYFDSSTSFGTVTFTWLAFAGLVTILVMAEIATISDEIYEAAYIDGASDFQVDIHIKLPLLRNILGTCVILSATSMLKEFELIYLTTGGGPDIATMNLPLYIYKTSIIEHNYGYANTISSVTILLGIVVIVGVNRLFRMGRSDI